MFASECVVCGVRVCLRLNAAGHSCKTICRLVKSEEIYFISHATGMTICAGSGAGAGAGVIRRPGRESKTMDSLSVSVSLTRSLIHSRSPAPSPSRRPAVDLSFSHVRAIMPQTAASAPVWPYLWVQHAIACPRNKARRYLNSLRLVQHNDHLFRVGSN